MKKIVIGILAHVDSGKTTLSEALLYCCKSIKKLGRVDRGDSHLDTFSMERSRGITIFSKQAVFEHGGTEFTLIDTPGHVDFSAETERALQILDYAVLVISAADGIQSHTQTLWKLLSAYKVPCFIFVNKTDLENSGREHIMQELKSKLSAGCVSFSAENSGELYESIALCGEELLEKYYESGEIEKSDIINAVKSRTVIPCLFGSALKLTGILEFLDCLSAFSKAPQYSADFAARVYKISEDKGQRLTFLKITGGSLKVKDVLPSEKNKNGEKVNQIRIYSGEKFKTVNEAEAGTVCAVTGISFAAVGDGLGAAKNAAPPILQPVLSYRLDLEPGGDAHTTLEKLRILEKEDPQIRAEFCPRTGEIRVQVMGDIQLELLKSELLQRFGISASFSTGGIIYKETITQTVEGVGHFEPLKHYAEVHVIMKPGKRNSGIIIKNECRDNIPERNWQRLIMTHLHEKTHVGVLTGSPVTDIEITLVSGRAHPKHTEGGDFRQAAYRAVRQGLRCAECILLEPVYEFTLEVPCENIGRAIADIQHMDGSFSAPETEGEFSVLKGTAPVSAMRGYAKELAQYTKGRGRLSCSLKGYEPCRNAQEVIAESNYNCDGDTDNPCDSVFCSHGAGYTVKWNEVKSHMHLPSALSAPKNHFSALELKKAASGSSKKSDLFALDKELMQIFEQTYGPVKRRTQSSEKRRFSFDETAGGKKYKSKSKHGHGTEEYLLVDGYNVIFSRDPLKSLAGENADTARNMLINILCNYQGYKKCKVILVFDAYRVKGAQREVEKKDNITVVYTKEAETADMYIEKASYKLAENNRVRVVTSDALEQLIILGNGALRVSSAEFFDEVKQAEEEIREIISSQH